jgi:hypothetical protein
MWYSNNSLLWGVLKCFVLISIYGTCIDDWYLVNINPVRKGLCCGVPADYCQGAVPTWGMGKIHLSKINDLRWRLSNLSLTSQKFLLMENAERPTQTKCLLPNTLFGFWNCSWFAIEIGHTSWQELSNGTCLTWIPEICIPPIGRNWSHLKEGPKLVVKSGGHFFPSIVWEKWASENPNLCVIYPRVFTFDSFIVMGRDSRIAHWNDSQWVTGDGIKLIFFITYGNMHTGQSWKSTFTNKGTICASLYWDWFRLKYARTSEYTWMRMKRKKKCGRCGTTYIGSSTWAQLTEVLHFFLFRQCLPLRM